MGMSRRTLDSSSSLFVRVTCVQKWGSGRHAEECNISSGRNVVAADSACVLRCVARCQCTWTYRLAVDGTCHVDVWGCLTSAVTLLRLQTGCNRYSLQQMQKGALGHCLGGVVA